MKIARKTVAFLRAEDGTLLVFFAICTVALLGIMALSFDMGRRASTQSDMQSFADNVALAAAGELDGKSTAITRATNVANTAIVAANEALKKGASGTTATLSIAQIVFYKALPPSDTPTSFTVANLSASKYTLPSGNAFVTTDPTKARYVGIRLNKVGIAWLFGGVFGNGIMASAANTDPGAVGAIAVAGKSGWACDVAPLMFCVPQATDGPAGPVLLDPGTSILLRAGGSDQGFWGPGDFGFLRLNEVPIDPEGPCDGLNPNQTDACLINVKQNITQCFRTDGVDMDPGQRNGATAVIFNIAFDMYRTGNTKPFESNELYAPGPHTVSGQRDPAGGTICESAKLEPTGDTMPYPGDDCLSGGATCTVTNSRGQTFSSDRVGDADWSAGQRTYFDVNYGVYDPGTTHNFNPIPGSGTGGTNNFFNGGQASYFSDPVFDQSTFPDYQFAGSQTRYQTYLKEIQRAAAAAAGTMATEFPVDPDGPYTTKQIQDWVDSWAGETADPANGLMPVLPKRDKDDGLPQCTNKTGVQSPDRRVLVIAGIDCAANGIKGAADNVPVHQFYRAFMMQPVGVNGTNEDIWVEIIEPVGGDAAGATLDTGIYRELVQLYR